VRGRVLPMCTEPLDIGADVTGLGADPARGAPHPRPGGGGVHPGPGAAGVAGPRPAAGLPRRVGRRPPPTWSARAGVVVHQRAAAPARPRAARRR
jgi:hypothetical protein